jgi:tripartite-type tricarboxylate transporter receptor subunit TctC
MLGQAVVVENRAGAAGNIAMEHVAHARPDGYTLVLPAMAYVVNPLLFATVPYRLEDFAPVSLVARGPLVLVVASASPEKTLAGLIDHARAKPGTFRYGSGGNGSSPHLAAELFRFETRIELTHIPYKGTNDVLPDLMNGSLEMAILSPLTVEQQVRAGRLRALGVTSSRRLSSLPDVPAIAEAVPGYRMEGWYVLLAPSGTPAEVLERLSRDALSVLGSPDVKSRLESQGMQAAGENGGQAAEFMRTESTRWHKVLRAAGITPQ